MSKNDHIVVLTGAGISVESGLDTFRGNFGLWGQHKVEDIATPEAFATQPELVHKFYNQRRQQLKKVQPNPAHVALATLEKNWPGKITLITQNVDDLHERAGSTQLIHMHGKLSEARCIQSGTVFPCEENLDTDSLCECCQVKGNLRPNIVWFGEYPFGMSEIFTALDQADQFWSIGTSAHVYPAGGFAQHVLMNRKDARMIECNTENSQISHLFPERHEGPASQTVTKLVDSILEEL
ncbi:MAG: NAD-dependent deacylase [Bdellovibrionales bacterium]|nr:NAD-dependent deacylase [Bdellovibrionales bacterium]